MKHRPAFFSLIRIVTLILLLTLLASCSAGKNPDAPLADGTTEAVTTEPPFDASVYTYTPSLKDESEMKFCVVFSDGVIVELPQFIKGAPRFTEAGAEKFLGDPNKANAIIDGFNFDQIIRISGDRLPVIKYSDDLNIKLTNSLKLSEKFYFKVTESSGAEALGERYSQMPEQKGEYFLVIGASHNGEYGDFDLYYVAKIINA